MKFLTYQDNPKPHRMALCGTFAMSFLGITTLGQIGPDQNAKKSENMLVRDWLKMFIM